MTSSSTDGGGAPAREAAELSYAKEQDRDGGAQAGTARNVLVIVVKSIGLMIIVGTLWSAIDSIFGAATYLSGLNPDGYWSGSFGQLFYECVIEPADSYLVGAALIFFAEKIAPWALPRTWWQ